MDENVELSPAQSLEDFEQRRLVEDLTEAASAAATLIPGFGGAIQATLSGRLSARKGERLAHVLRSIVADLQATQKKVNTEFVKNGDFEDLFDEALPRILRERSEQKRIAYKNILVGALTSAYTEPYDRSVRFLRTLDELQEAHFYVLRVLGRTVNAEDRGHPGEMGSMGSWIVSQLPDVYARDIRRLVDDLDNARLTNISSDLNTTMSRTGFIDTYSRVSADGRAFIQYVLEV